MGGVHLNIVVTKIDFQTIRVWLGSRFRGDRVILFNTEPESAYPPNSRWLSKLFTDFQVHFGRLEGTTSPIRYPVDMTRMHIKGLKRFDQACFLASNRFSPFPVSNYQLRGLLVKELPPQILKVAGGLWALRRWDKVSVVLKHVLLSIFSLSEVSWKKCVAYVSNPCLPVGPVDDKFQFLRNYAVALVVENENSYISEKLIEAIQAGCIPVYVGPEIPKDWIPQDLYIRADRDIDSIYASLKLALKRDLSEAQQLQSKWLQSDSALLWSRELVYKRANDELEKKINGTQIKA